MSSKNNGSPVSPGIVLSVFCLLLYSAGFIRIELKFNDHVQRLVAVEKAISQQKHRVAQTSNKGIAIPHGERQNRTMCCIWNQGFFQKSAWMSLGQNGHRVGLNGVTIRKKVHMTGQRKKV
ncbi:hypothetical protein ACROYT_G022895 [Oculina patagonica]